MPVFRPPQRKLLPVGKVEIDPAHPLSNGLVLFKFAGAFDRVDTVNFGPDLAGWGPIGSPVARAGQEGPALTSGAVNYGPGSTSTFNLPQTVGTVSVRLAAGWSPTDGGNHVPVWITNNVDNGFRAQKYSDNNWYIGWQNASGDSRVQVAASGGFVAGEAFNLTLTYNSATGSILYTKGIQRGTKVSPLPVPNTTAGGQFSLGNDAASNGAWNSTASSAIYYIAVWNRVLTASEAQLLDADPYGFLIPEESEPPALSSGAPAAPSGTLVATEAPDIAAITGTFVTADVSGTLVATEAPDVAAITGTAGGATGTLTATEAPDVALINGAFAITGTLTATEATDVAAITATYAVAGLLVATEPADAAVIVGSYAITGILTATEAVDTASITGSGAVASGTLVATETADVAALVGTAGGAAGTLTVTEAQDTASLSGTFALTGTLVAIETPDAAVIFGTAGGASGALVVTEAADIAALTGSVAGVVSGILAATEVPDIAAFTGTVQLTPTGPLTATEAPDNVLILADYRPPTAGGVPYPSKRDYGWFKGDPPLKKKWR